MIPPAQPQYPALSSFPSAATAPKMGMQSSTPQTAVKGVLPPPKAATPTGSSGLLSPKTAQASTATLPQVQSPQTVTTGGSNPVLPSNPTLPLENPNRDMQKVTAPTSNTFPGMLGGLVSNSMTGSPLAGAAGAGLIGLSGSNPATSGTAYENYIQAVNAKKKLSTDIAQAYANNENQAIPLFFQQGRAQVMARQFASQEEAAQQAVNEAQAGIGQQIQGTQVQQAGLTSAGGLGNTAQGLLQSGLTSAATLGQPNQASYGQTVFNPITGQYEQGGGLPADVMQQYAQMAATGQYSSIPSFITSNPVLNAQLNVAAKAANPGYTPVGAQGASSVLQGIPAMQSAETAAEGIKNTIQTYIAANPNLNPSDLAAGNMLKQWIEGKQLTDPKYQTLFNYLNEYTNTLAPILGVGGDPTNLKTQIAMGFINAAASGQSISTVLSTMSELAKNKIRDMQSGAIGGNTSVPSAGNNTSGFAETW